MSNIAFQRQPGASSLSGLVVSRLTSFPVSLKVNLTAVVDPTVTDDTAAGYAPGSLWINTVLQTVFWCAAATAGAAVWRQVAGGSASGSSIRETITLANTFAAGDIVRKTSSNWAKSLADTASNSPVTGIIESATAGTFVVVYGGKMALTGHGFTLGSILYLSSATAGLLTATEPTAVGAVSRPVAVALDANNILVLNQRGMTNVASGAPTGTPKSTNVAIGLAYTNILASVPSGKSWRIKNLRLVNNSASAVTFTLSFSDGTVTVILEDTFTLGAYSTYSIEGLVVPSGGTLKALCSAATSLYAVCAYEEYALTAVLGAAVQLDTTDTNIIATVASGKVAAAKVIVHNTQATGQTFTLKHKDSSTGAEVLLANAYTLGARSSASFDDLNIAAGGYLKGSGSSALGNIVCAVAYTETNV